MQEFLQKLPLCFFFQNSIQGFVRNFSSLQGMLQKSFQEFIRKFNKNLELIASKIFSYKLSRSSSTIFFQILLELHPEISRRIPFKIFCEFLQKFVHGLFQKTLHGFLHQYSQGDLQGVSSTTSSVASSSIEHNS